MKINDYFINPEEDKQTSYRLIYSLALVDLETLKMYIKINVKSSFI